VWEVREEYITENGRLRERLNNASSMVVKTLTRPYRVTPPMVLLVSMVPLYLFIPGFLDGRTFHAPELSLDRAVPLQPIWTLLYGPLYAFLIVLPVLVVRQEELIRRTVFAYLLVWTTAYVCFLVYPTTLTRPTEITGSGFGAWSLGLVYSSDPPYNCFPSLHVAHSFVSALACLRVHRRVGIAALLAASLVGLSALFIKQHYVLDVIAGIFLAGVSGAIFLRGYSRAAVPELDRRAAPVIAGGLFAIVCLVVACGWLLFEAFADHRQV
jgi:membrane-associated phospholipid phosphatase